MIIFLCEIVSWMNVNILLIKVVKLVIGMVEMLVYEIKNFLVGIIGVVQLLLMNLEVNDQEMMDLIVDECCCIVKLLEQVEQFGNFSKFVVVLVNIYDILDCVCQLVLVGFGVYMMFVEEYDLLLLFVFVDGDQLFQVFLNLLKNVFEVGKVGGNIWLYIFYDVLLCICCFFDEELVCLLFQIEIIDDGFGLLFEIVLDVFEFFVLGCENGMGLGLVFVLKFVGDNGGWIFVDLVLGCIVFCVFLLIVFKIFQNDGVN